MAAYGFQSPWKDDMRQNPCSWSPVPDGFTCLHESPGGRAVACWAAGRLIVESRGLCLVLRLSEVIPLLNHLNHALTCPAARVHLERGGSIRLRDALRGHFTDLELAPLEDLIHVLEAVIPPLFPSAESPMPPQASAIIGNPISAQGFRSLRKTE
jgi:hypothetical protein